MTKKQKILVYTFLVIISLLSIFPIYWMACAATNTSVDIMRGKLIPGGYLIENFKSLIGNQDLGRAFVNSVRNSVLLTLFSMIICSIAGYGFEVYHQKSKDVLFTVLLAAMMLPFVATMIPLFTMFSKAGMVNSWLAFMLPGLATPFLIMMFRQAARSFPKEIIEAARMDSLSEVGIFFTMFVPTMRSTYGAAVTVTFMSTWNSYLWPKVIFQKNESTTMPMLVANLLGAYTVDYGMLMLEVLIATLPTAVVFFMLQKQFAEGITGAIK